jgi:hypothetical protein
MTTHQQNAQALIEKIQSLPTDRIEEVEDFVDFLKTRTKRKKMAAPRKQAPDFPVISVGAWPEDLSLHREDLYGDDGR